MQVVGAVKPDVLLFFGQVLPGRFQHGAGFQSLITLDRVGNALIDVSFPSPQVFPFSEQFETSLLK